MEVGKLEFHTVLLLLFKMCVCSVQEINENSEKNSDKDDAFQETEWMDFAEGYYSRMQKKVNLIFKKKKKILMLWIL